MLCFRALRKATGTTAENTFGIITPCTFQSKDVFFIKLVCLFLSIQNNFSYLTRSCYLFREIFARTEPPSRYLQTLNIDFSKAQTMIDSVSSSLELMRDNADAIVGFDGNIEWNNTCVRRKSQNELI